jgi:hypothetical protein
MITARIVRRTLVVAATALALIVATGATPDGIGRWNVAGGHCGTPDHPPCAETPVKVADGNDPDFYVPVQYGPSTGNAVAGIGRWDIATTN